MMSINRSDDKCFGKMSLTRAQTMSELIYIKFGEEIIIPKGALILVDEHRNCAIWKEDYFQIETNEYTTF